MRQLGQVHQVRQFCQMCCVCRVHLLRRVHPAGGQAMGRSLRALVTALRVCRWAGAWGWCAWCGWFRWVEGWQLGLSRVWPNARWWGGARAHLPGRRGCAASGSAARRGWSVRPAPAQPAANGWGGRRGCGSAWGQMAWQTTQRGRVQARVGGRGGRYGRVDMASGKSKQHRQAALGRQVGAPRSHVVYFGF